MFGKCGIGGWCTSFYNLETDDDAAACNHPNADQGFEQLQNNQNRTACCGVSSWSSFSWYMWKMWNCASRNVKPAKEVDTSDI